MVDVFEEVEGELRAQRYASFARRAAPWIVGLIVLGLVAAAGLWGYDAWRNANVAKASETYDAALEKLIAGDKTGAFTGFGEAAKAGSPIYKALSLMQQGGMRQEDGKTAEAVALFDEAAKAAPSPLVGDAARLKSALALLDSADYPTLEQRLTPLAADKRPYQVLAKEALAMAKLKAGKVDEAKSDFEVLGLRSDAPEGLQERAQAALALIQSGGTKVVPDAVKAAAALPPQALQPPPPQAAEPQPAQ